MKSNISTGWANRSPNSNAVPRTSRSRRKSRASTPGSRADGYYRRPERSISYYNKGELLGVMLDLAVRDASHGQASLREVLQWMNANYAKKGRFFNDSDGVREAAEAVSHADLTLVLRQVCSRNRRNSLG